MSRQQTAERLGAAHTLADPARMAKSTANIDTHLPAAQFLSVVSRHVQMQTDAPEDVSPRIAAALALSDGKTREEYLTLVAGSENVDRYATSLRFIEARMNESDRAALHREVCTAVGTVH